MPQEDDGIERFHIEIVPAGIDSWSDIRSLHAISFRSHVAPDLDAAQAAAFLELVYSPDYSDMLQTHDVQAAVYDGRIVATAGWVPADDSGLSARVTSVYVSPLFGRLGIGRRVVSAIEARATAAGYHSFSARVFPLAIPFFTRLGYVKSSQGALAVGTDNGIPVTFMRKTRLPRLEEPGTNAEGAGYCAGIQPALTDRDL